MHDASNETLISIIALYFFLAAALARAALVGQLPP